MDLELTPRTDKQVSTMWDRDGFPHKAVDRLFARELEKDLNKALNALKMIEGLNNDDFPHGDFSNEAIRVFNYARDIMFELENKLK